MRVSKKPSILSMKPSILSMKPTILSMKPSILSMKPSISGLCSAEIGLLYAQHPDLQFHFVPACVVGQAEILTKHGYQTHCSTMRPLSRGGVTLSSADPHAAPLIDPNYFSHPQDVEDIRNGVRLTLEIAEQQSLQALTSHRFSPGPELDPGDDEQVDAFVRENCHSAYHPCCTAAMGSVVDESGKVYGVRGLRVVDASVMPSMVSGNLNAPTIMLAERIADVVRAQSLPQLDYQGRPKIDCVQKQIKGGDMLDEATSVPWYQVSFQWKNPDFLLKNPDFLLKNVDFMI